MNTTTTTTSTMNERLPLNKKPSIYSGSSDSRYLHLLSKAALLDLCVEMLRRQYASGTPFAPPAANGSHYSPCCIDPLTAEVVRDAIAATIAARGDRLPNISK